MNIAYQQFISLLEDASINIDSFMRGEMLPFGLDTKVHEDAIYKSLLGLSDFGHHTVTASGVVLPAWAVQCLRLFVDHRSGGN